MSGTAPGRSNRPQARGLKGWVRNRADGSVEALFAGPADKVADMIAACHQGPKPRAWRVWRLRISQGTSRTAFAQTSDA